MNFIYKDNKLFQFDKSRKFPRHLDNLIDDWIIDKGKDLYPFWRKMNFTPNDLTTVSLVLGVISVLLFYKKWFILSAISYFLSYCFDVFDGNYARKYNLTTKFGDYYDHIKDLLVNVLMGYVFLKYSKLDKRLLIFVSIVAIILFIISNIHLGCQEIYNSFYNPEHKNTYLAFLKVYCNKKFISNINILKHFGCGTFFLWMTLIILLNVINR